MSPTNEPVIADKKPIVTELAPGNYYWCSCGRSQNQPFCDGAHKGTGFTPLVFELDEKKTVALCLCKHTDKPPFCDGSHQKLPA